LRPPPVFVADALDVFLHEAVIVAPADAGGSHRRLLGAGGDLEHDFVGLNRLGIPKSGAF
jgi:hypothetical protein